MNPRIALITGEQWKTGSEENQLLREALSKREIDSEMVVWDEGVKPLSNFDASIIRSCWDYHQRSTEFLEWLKQLNTAETKIWNSPEILRWNMDKGYLQDLEDAGLPVIPSVFFDRGTMPDLEEVMDEHNWSEVVVKPRIGASGHFMHKITREEITARIGDIQTVANQRGIFIQPYLDEMRDRGEWSFIFFDGTYQFAIHKQPGPEDFRAHNHRGGTYRHAQPQPEWIEHVQSLVDRFPKDCLYQRMDGLIRNDQLLLIEVEALEPSFYFSYYPDGAESLAEIIEEKLSIRQPI